MPRLPVPFFLLIIHRLDRGLLFLWKKINQLDKKGRDGTQCRPCATERSGPGQPAGGADLRPAGDADRGVVFSVKKKEQKQKRNIQQRQPTRGGVKETDN